MRGPRTGAAVVALFASLTIGACSDACDNHVVKRVSAPGGAKEAVLFQRDCGATTGFSTQISIVPVGETPTGKGDAFVADDDHGAAVTGEWGGPWAEATWISADRVLIRYAAKARVFVSNQSASGVAITYETAPR